MAHPPTPSMRSALAEKWCALALRGLLAVLFGLAALFLPLDTLVAVGRLFGAYAITEGMLVILTGIRRTRYRGVFIAEGVAAIVAGPVAPAWPGVAALVLPYAVAIWATLSGVAELIAAVSLRRETEGGWALFFVGGSRLHPRGGYGGSARRGAALGRLVSRALRGSRSASC